MYKNQNFNLELKWTPSSTNTIWNSTKACSLCIAVLITTPSWLPSGSIQDTDGFGFLLDLVKFINFNVFSYLFLSWLPRVSHRIAYTEAYTPKTLKYNAWIVYGLFITGFILEVWFILGNYSFIFLF